MLLSSRKIHLSPLKMSNHADVAWSPSLICQTFPRKSWESILPVVTRLLYIQPLSFRGRKLSDKHKHKSPHIFARFSHHLRGVLLMAGSTMRRSKSQRYFLCEVAPSMMRWHRRCSSCPRLETISEEGTSSEGLSGARTTVLQTRAVYLLPIFLSFMSCYFLLYGLWQIAVRSIFEETYVVSSYNNCITYSFLFRKKLRVEVDNAMPPLNLSKIGRRWIVSFRSIRCSKGRWGLDPSHHSASSPSIAKGWWIFCQSSIFCDSTHIQQKKRKGIGWWWA